MTKYKQCKHRTKPSLFTEILSSTIGYKKDDPHQIQITAGGNLIKYESNLSMRTTNLDTAKLHWNSVISSYNAKYMCIDIKNFYLTAKLDYFKYMWMPWLILPTPTQLLVDCGVGDV